MLNKAAGENVALSTFLFHILFTGLQPPLFPLSPLWLYSRESDRNRLPTRLQQQLCQVTATLLCKWHGRWGSGHCVPRGQRCHLEVQWKKKRCRDDHCNFCQVFGRKYNNETKMVTDWLWLISHICHCHRLALSQCCCCHWQKVTVKDVLQVNRHAFTGAVVPASCTAEETAAVKLL